MLGEAPKRALETLGLRCAGFDVELRILGCSHQVLVDRLHGGLSEVLACLPGRKSHLPTRLTRPGAYADYAFSSRVWRLGAAGFGRRAQAVLGATGSDPHALVGLFPGLPHAFTALRCRASERGLAWESWHSYPQSREIVHTRSELRPG